MTVLGQLGSPEDQDEALLQMGCVQMHACMLPCQGLV